MTQARVLYRMASDMVWNSPVSLTNLTSGLN